VPLLGDQNDGGGAIVGDHVVVLVEPSTRVGVRGRRGGLVEAKPRQSGGQAQNPGGWPTRIEMQVGKYVPAGLLQFALTQGGVAAVFLSLGCCFLHDKWRLGLNLIITHIIESESLKESSAPLQGARKHNAQTHTHYIQHKSHIIKNLSRSGTPSESLSLI